MEFDPSKAVPTSDTHKEFYDRVIEIAKDMGDRLTQREQLALLSQITGQCLATQPDEPGECYMSMMVNINYGQLEVYRQLSTIMNVEGSA